RAAFSSSRLSRCPGAGVYGEQSPSLDGGTMPPELPAGVDRMLRCVRVDFAPTPRHPSVLSLATALVVAVAGSLAADALLVAAGTALFPATKGYGHFPAHGYCPR